jgi:PAS domain S-box-containing protein
MKVLIAEDDPVSLLSLQDALQEWGYEVVTACDGKMACEILQRPDAPPLAIIDWMMPGMDGVDICRVVRETVRDRYIYLIMLTSRSETEFVVAAMNAGADDFIAKPFDDEELQVRIRAGRRINELEQKLRISATRAEETLAVVAANEIRIQTIIETSHDAFIGMDLRGYISDWNSKAEQMFGWTKEEAVGQRLTTMIPERYQLRFEQDLRTFRETGKGDFLDQHIERTIVNRKGEEFPVDVTVGLAGTHENFFFGMFLHDISDRKQVERMKNEFISTVSHELRTPLTSIRGSLGLLTGGALGDFSPQASTLLDIANKNCQRLVRMINNVLDIEKMESGNMRFDMVKQALLPLVEQAIEATQGYAAEFNVTVQLQCNMPDIADLQVAVDRDRMIQVLVNLLSNAIKYSPAGVPVEVRICREPGSVRLSVADHGNGIPEEFQDRIFQKFAQADSTDSRQKGGTGLGLSICKSIVGEHRGHIDFRSAAGQGTEFYVTLPLPADAVPVRT